MSDTNLLDSLCATELRDAIAARSLSALEAVRHSLERIDALNPTLNACTQVFHERALQRARDVDEGKLTGPLAGVPIAVKDNLCTSLGFTTCASKMLEHYRSPFDATAVARLEAAGAIILAKTNMDEFGMGSSTESSIFGPTRNPLDTTRVAGGSSGGSAAAVASGMCAAALGTDTGGSVRQPASFCGLVGLKPTYGSVSRSGLVAYASSLDQVGPFTKTVADCALIMSVLAGHDPNDSTSHDGPYPDYSAPGNRDLAGVRIGVLHGTESEAVRTAAESLGNAGATILDLEIPHERYAVPAYYLIATAEASSNLARYDGVRFGHRAETVGNLEELFSRSRAEGFGPEVKRRIMLGTYALCAGYHDAWYLRASKIRRLIRRDFDLAFQQCDAILSPATNGPAFHLGEIASRPLASSGNDTHTVTANLTGLPALVVPSIHATPDHPLPIGAQLIAPPFHEPLLLRLGATIRP